MSKRKYAIVVWCYVLLLGLFAGTRNPYGSDFFPTIAPALLLLVSLQWLLLSSRFGWQVGVGCTAFAGAVLIFLARQSWARANPANYLLLVLIAAFFHLILLWLLAPDKSARSIVIAENLSVVLITLLGTRLVSYDDTSFAFPRTSRFLFWSPLAAMSLWINGAISGWRKAGRIIFICLVAQNSIGFFDMGVKTQATWLYVCAGGCFLAAFAFLIGWAGELNK